jgi:peptide/nickel transport system substrate-binding protein
MINLVNDPLLFVNSKGILEPGLATSVPTGGSDGNTYTFKLHSGVKWSDGTPLTSADVLFTYNLIFAPEYSAVASPRRGDFTLHVDSISAPDPETFVIHTKTTYAPLLYSHGVYPIMPKHVLGSIPPAQINTMSYNSAPTVTSGQFKFVSWQQGAQTTLARNETYWRGAPYLSNYVFKVLPSAVAIGNALKTGEVNVGAQLDPSSLTSLETVQGLNIHNFVTPSFEFLALNQNPQKPAGAILQDVKVRQALYYAINRESMIKSILFGEGSNATGVEPPTSWAYDPNAKPQYPYNPSKANQILDEAGWTKGSNGIRSKNGTRLAFTLHYPSGVLTLTNISQVVQQNWKAIGVDLTPVAIQFTQLVTELTATRDYDIILVGFNFTNDPDQSQLFSSSGTAVGGFNGMDFSNPQVDKLLNEGTATLSKQKRIDIYKQYQNLMQELVPIILLYFSKQAYGTLSSVHGMQLNTFQQYARPWMNKVWVSSS